MVVKRMTGVAFLGEIVGDSLAGVVVKNRFVRIFRRAEVREAHARQHFKFGVSRARTDNGNGQKSVRVIGFESGEIFHGIFRKGEVFKIIHVEKGFELNDYNVRLRPVLFHGRSAYRDKNVVYVFGTVIVGTFDAAVKNADAERVGKAVVVICVGEVREAVRENARAQKKRQKSEKNRGRKRNGDGGGAVIRFFLLLFYEDENKERNKRGNTDADKDNLPEFEVNEHNAPYRAEQTDVGGGKGRYSEETHDKIGDAEHAPNARNEDKDRSSFSEEQGEREREENYCKIEKKQVRTTENEVKKARGRAVVCKFGCEREHKSRQKRFDERTYIYFRFFRAFVHFLCSFPWRSA